MKPGRRTAAIAVGVLCLAIVAAVLVVRRTPSLHTEEAIRIAVDAYIYGYPLVTFDMARRQQTNVAAPDAEHAPMGQRAVQTLRNDPQMRTAFLNRVAAPIVNKLFECGMIP